MRIVINGFGRIGRSVLRQILSHPDHADIDVVQINDIAPIDTCAYLFQYDSTFGPYPEKVEAGSDHLSIGGARIPFTQTPDIATQDLNGVDVVLECTGHVTSREMAERGLRAGAGNVLVSGPCPHADVTVVKGANDQALGAARIVSNSSCTTNAIAPVLRGLNETLGIVRAHVTTIHCYTGSQPMVDAPRADLARSRAGGESIVPTTTSAARELDGILPALAGRTTIAAVRVPSLSVSAIDITLQLRAPIAGCAKDVLRDLANRTSVLGLTEDACVSRDMRARAESCVLALPETMLIDGTQLRVFGWYDNEWGFSARMIDMARRMVGR